MSHSIKNITLICTIILLAGAGCRWGQNGPVPNSDGVVFLTQEDIDGNDVVVGERAVFGSDDEGNSNENDEKIVDSEDEQIVKDTTQNAVDDSSIVDERGAVLGRVDMSQYDATYRFSAEIPAGWQIEQVGEIDSINIYDPNNESNAIRDKSQIFIRQFEAKDFLTLGTVDILEKNLTSVNGHDAVEYRIVKKAGVNDFPAQPYWRNLEHDLIDIRLSSTGKTWFYVFSYSPELDKQIFNAFIQSLVFHNDTTSFIDPMDKPLERITKKNFATEVFPENSPVENERFSGFHTGIDLELSEDEYEKDMPVRAFCGGPIIEKRTASGYGGLVVQECLHDDQRLVIIYGHLNITSVVHAQNAYLAPGTFIGNLGNHQSTQTDGERKHLHFGVYIGKGEDIRGYVSNSEDLGYWVNPVALLTS
jgi:hypothetical protein